MSVVVESLKRELEKLEREVKDQDTRKEIATWRIRLQRGSLKHKIESGPLTIEQKERALKRLFKKKGWDLSIIK
jgi:hypothetical protein